MNRSSDVCRAILACIAFLSAGCGSVSPDERVLRAALDWQDLSHAQLGLGVVLHQDTATGAGESPSTDAVSAAVTRITEIFGACLTATPVSDFQVEYAFASCDGPFGLSRVNGIIDADYAALEGERFVLALTARPDFRIGDSSLDLRATMFGFRPDLWLSSTSRGSSPSQVALDLTTAYDAAFDATEDRLEWNTSGAESEFVVLDDDAWTICEEGCGPDAGYTRRALRCPEKPISSRPVEGESSDESGSRSFSLYFEGATARGSFREGSDSESFEIELDCAP